MYRRLTAKFAGKCNSCRTMIPQGAACWYDKALPARGRMQCDSCHAKQPAQPAPGAQPAPRGAEHECQRFDSVADLMHSISTVPEVNADRLRRSVLEHSSDATWHGVEGGYTAVAALHTAGWQDGVARMLDALGKLTLHAAPTSLRRRLVRDSHGDDVDPHRVNCGDFGRCWTRRARRSVRAPQTVTLVSDWNQHCGEEAERAFWRGAAVLRLADLLADAGYAVEIVGYFRALDPFVEGKGSRSMYVNIKSAADPVDVNSLAASLCCAGTFRVYGFASILNSTRAVDSGLGRPDYVSAPDVDDGGPQHAMMLHARAAKVYDQATATAWLEEAIATVEAGAAQPD